MSKQFMVVLVGVVAVAALGYGAYSLGRNQSNGSPNPVQRPSNPAAPAQQVAPAAQPSTDPAVQPPAPGQEPQARQQEQPAAAAAVEQPKELAANKVRGKIIDTGWRTYVVRSQDTGKKYSFAYGRITKYSKRRRLDTGDRVTVTYQYDRNRLVASYIDVH